MSRICWKCAVGIMIAAIGIGVLGCPWQNRLTVIHKGGQGPPTLVLLHGYGSSAEQWLPFTQTLSFPSQGRFLFPKAPEKMPRTDGAPAGHVWWNLDLVPYSRPGGTAVELVEENPEGLERAAGQVRALLAAEGNSADHPFILGGFSQGAMVSCQVAFASDEPLAALVILSGTLINQTTWKAHLARRKGLPVFMSHGRSDPILPFDLAERLHADLLAAGLPVTFVAFDGSHEIPAEVVIALGDFLARLKQ